METVQGPARTFWLSMHVPYACRHAGVCCSSGWDIPIERERVPLAGALRSDVAWLRPVGNAPPDVAGVLAVTDGGTCVFRTGRCEIQRAYGHGALPAACQHFPREVLIDPRGVFVTLSHYCPTALERLLVHAGPVEIVPGPPVLPEGEPEGLDARDVLPPLLVEGVLMDWEGYSAWEAHMVAVLTGGGAPERCVARLEEDLREVQRWRPGGLPLRAAIGALPRGLPRGQATNRESAPRTLNADVVIGRYLAARAFASWDAFGPGGVTAVLTQLKETLRVLRTQNLQRSLSESIRETDLHMVHLRPRSTAAL